MFLLLLVCPSLTLRLSAVTLHDVSAARERDPGSETQTAERLLWPRVLRSMSAPP